MVGCRLPEDFISEEEGNEEEKGVEELSYLRRRRGVEKKVVLENKDKGRCQKRFSGFCPLRGGGTPPCPLSFFEHTDCPLRGGECTPQFR